MGKKTRVHTPRHTLQSLESPKAAERLATVEALTEANDPGAAGHLAARLEIEEDAEVLQAIFRAFARLGTPGADDTLVTLLRHPSPSIRGQAVQALQQRGEAALPSLLRAMRSGTRNLRKLVLEVIGGAELGSSEIWDLALSDADQEVVMAAVTCAARNCNRRLTARIEQHLLDAADPVLLRTCMDALACLGDSHSIAVVRRRFPSTHDVPLPLLPAWLQVTTPRFARSAG